MDNELVSAVVEAAARGAAGGAVDNEKQSNLERTYQHAADWLRMANSITWNVASVYLVSSVFAMNTALTRPAGSTERHTIGIIWLVLLVIWFLVDLIYLQSASHARAKIAEVENDGAFKGAKFYLNQKEQWWFWGPGVLNILLVFSALALAALWIAVTFVWPDLPPAEMRMIQ